MDDRESRTLDYSDYSVLSFRDSSTQSGNRTSITRPGRVERSNSPLEPISEISIWQVLLAVATNRARISGQPDTPQTPQYASHSRCQGSRTPPLDLWVVVEVVLVVKLGLISWPGELPSWLLTTGRLVTAWIYWYYIYLFSSIDRPAVKTTPVYVPQRGIRNFGKHPSRPRL